LRALREISSLLSHTLMPGSIRKVSRQAVSSADAKSAKYAIINIVYSFFLYFFLACFAVLGEPCVKSSLPSSLFTLRYLLFPFFPLALRG